LSNPKGPPSSLVQLRIAGTHGDARDTRPKADIGVHNVVARNCRKAPHFNLLVLAT